MQIFFLPFNFWSQMLYHWAISPLPFNFFIYKTAVFFSLNLEDNHTKNLLFINKQIITEIPILFYKSMNICIWGILVYSQNSLCFRRWRNHNIYNLIWYECKDTVYLATLKSASYSIISRFHRIFNLEIKTSPCISVSSHLAYSWLWI